MVFLLAVRTSRWFALHPRCVAISFALQYEFKHGERPLGDPGDHIGHLDHFKVTRHKLTLDVSRSECRAHSFENEFCRSSVGPEIDVMRG